MMKLLRWSNPRTQAPGARHQTSVFHGERGWKSRKISAPPAEGEKCSLTFPFIEQAFTQVSVLHHLWCRRCHGYLREGDLSPIALLCRPKSVQCSVACANAIKVL